MQAALIEIDGHARDNGVFTRKGKRDVYLCGFKSRSQGQHLNETSPSTTLDIQIEAKEQKKGSSTTYVFAACLPLPRAAPKYLWIRFKRWRLLKKLNTYATRSLMIWPLTKQDLYYFVK